MPATQKQGLRAALKARNYPLAYSRALEMDQVDLREAMELTILAAEQDRDHFQAMSIHWIERLLRERYVSTQEIGWVAQRFQDAWEERPLEPEKALADFLEKAPLRVDILLAKEAQEVIGLADRRDPSYESACRHFLVRVLQEIKPEIIQAKKLADCLAHADHGLHQAQAREGLERVVGQLERIEKLDISFTGPQP